MLVISLNYVPRWMSPVILNDAKIITKPFQNEALPFENTLQTVLFGEYTTQFVL